jgi:hypothetical protein
MVIISVLGTSWIRGLLFQNKFLKPDNIAVTVTVAITVRSIRTAALPLAAYFYTAAAGGEEASFTSHT